VPSPGHEGTTLTSLYLEREAEQQLPAFLVGAVDEQVALEPENVERCERDGRSALAA